jgi:hypothetical protein
MKGGCKELRKSHQDITILFNTKIMSSG